MTIKCDIQSYAISHFDESHKLLFKIFDIVIETFNTSVEVYPWGVYCDYFGEIWLCYNWTANDCIINSLGFFFFSNNECETDKS